MEKIAKKRRSLINTLIESGGSIAESDANPFKNVELKEIMDKLRGEVDDPVRALIFGEAFGKAPQPDGGSLKSILATAQTAINRRQYLVAAHAISQFDARMEIISDMFSKFAYENIEKIHEEFKTKPLTEKQKEDLIVWKKRLQDRRDKIKAKTAMHKEANIFGDWYHNITTDEGKALAFWEKRFPIKVKKLKVDTVNLVKAAQSLLGAVLTVMKNLEGYRAKRDAEAYIEESKKIINRFNLFNNVSDKYEADHVAFLEKIQGTSTKLPEAANDVASPSSAPQKGKTEIALSAPTLPPGSVPQRVQTKINPDPISISPPSSLPPAVIRGQSPGLSSNIPGPVDSSQVATIPRVNPQVASEQVDTSKDKSAPVDLENGPVTMRSNTHREFYEALKSLANAPSYVLSAYICKYAKLIQSTDTDTAIKLFKIARSLKQ